MGALGQLFGRIRANPWLGVAVVGAALLVLAWIAWAIHVGTDKGFSHSLGVLIAWPALIVAAILVSLPFVGIFLYVRRLARDSSSPEEDRREEQAEAEQAEVTETG